jgi:hypothetical protein
VTQNNYQLGSGQLGRELGTADNVVVDNVISNAGAEDIADALIEDQLGSNTGIDAADDYGRGEGRSRPDLAEEVTVPHVL